MRRWWREHNPALADAVSALVVGFVALVAAVIVIGAIIGLFA